MVGVEQTVAVDDGNDHQGRQIVDHEDGQQQGPHSIRDTATEQR